MSEFKFKPSDFLFPNHFTGSCKWERDLAEALAKSAAESANARLQQMLAECPRVYGQKFTDTNDTIDGWHVNYGALSATHSARLVDIKVIGEEK